MAKTYPQHNVPGRRDPFELAIEATASQYVKQSNAEDLMFTGHYKSPRAYAYFFSNKTIEVRNGKDVRIAKILPWRLVDGLMQYYETGNGRYNVPSWHTLPESIQQQYQAWLAKELLR